MSTSTFEAMDTTAIVPSLSIDALLLRRDASVNAFNAACAAIEGDPVTGSLFHLSNSVRCYSLKAEDAIKEIDADYWRELMDKSGLWTFLDRTARKEWREALDKRAFPELTADNIRATFEGIHAQRGEMVARGIRELFDRLSIEHKTNSKSRFTPKLIFNYAWGAFGMEHHAADQFDDLNRAIHVLRGMPEPDHRQGAYFALNKAEIGEWTDFGPFLRVKPFKKGTVHVEFVHEADREKMNAALNMTAPKAVPGDRGGWWAQRDVRQA